MKGIMEDFLLFIIGVFAILVILSTVFGKGIAYNILGFLAEIEPSFLQEDIRTFLTVASYSPGEYEGKLEITLEHNISVIDDTVPMVVVTSPTKYKFSNTTPIAFLVNPDCDIIKTCTSVCGFIGDSCRAQEDCCGVLSCTVGRCASTAYTACGDGILNPGEECDPASNPVPPVFPNAECPGNCTESCTCMTNFTQCNDEYDNDGDGLINSNDPDCHFDLNATNPNSFDPANLKERRLIGTRCDNSNECLNFMECMTRVEFDKAGGILVVKKFFENSECKLKIEKWKK